MPDYRAIARQKAQKYGLDPYIFQRQINAESGFNPGAGSGAGAIGIAQFMPATAAGLGINPRDPVQALDGAAKLMAGYVKKYGSYEKALRAYNAGEGAIEKSRGYGETNAYVAKILSNGRDPGRLGSPRSSSSRSRASRSSSGGLSTRLVGGSPARTETVTASSGGDPVALPDTGASGLSELLLAGVGAKPQVQVSQGAIQAPSFSSEKYGFGSVQPVGLGSSPVSSSGVAGQLAALAASRPTDVPSVANAPSSASATARIPAVPGTTPEAAAAPTGRPTPKTASGGAKAAVDWARSTVGVAESGGPNRGARIDQWQARFGLKGAYWCAMWTSLAATKGGMDKSGRTPAVRDVRNAAQSGTAAYQKGFVDPRRAKAGDLILFGNDHIGMVEKNTGSGLVMIAGNDANRVNRRTVAYGSGDIVRPKYGR